LQFHSSNDDLSPSVYIRLAYILSSRSPPYVRRSVGQ
jgi:hypothetical protein